MFDAAVSDSSDEEDGRRLFRPLRDPLDLLSSGELRKRYRFDRQSILWITDLLRCDIEKKTNRSRAIPPHIQVLSFLDYMASNSLQTVIGQQLNIRQSSVSRCVTTVSDALVCHIGEFIHFPSDDERRAIARGFYDFPREGSPRLGGIIGAIDGSHVEMELLPERHEVDFINRKGRRSLNVQLVCDHQGRFLHINTDSPGSSHDASVLRDSNLWDAFEDGQLDGRYNEDWNRHKRESNSTESVVVEDSANATDDLFNDTEVSNTTSAAAPTTSLAYETTTAEEPKSGTTKQTTIIISEKTSPSTAAQPVTTKLQQPHLTSSVQEIGDTTVKAISTTTGAQLETRNTTTAAEVSAPEKKKKKKSVPWLIPVIVGGSLFVLAAIVVIVVCCCVKKKKKPHDAGSTSAADLAPIVVQQPDVMIVHQVGSEIEPGSVSVNLSNTQHTISSIRRGSPSRSAACDDTQPYSDEDFIEYAPSQSSSGRADFSSGSMQNTQLELSRSSCSLSSTPSSGSRSSGYSGSSQSRSTQRSSTRSSGNSGSWSSNTSGSR